MADLNEPKTFGRHNPTSASSSLPDHLAGSAADRNQNAHKLPEYGDSLTSWISDMERSDFIPGVRVSFFESVFCWYKVEVSLDKIV